VNLRILEPAIDDVAEASAYYESQSPGLGEDFELEFRRAMLAVIDNPYLAAYVERGVRRKRIGRFPYGIVYAIKSDTIMVGAVMHLR
jgi:toxin ParE1/3/4